MTWREVADRLLNEQICVTHMASAVTYRNDHETNAQSNYGRLQNLGVLFVPNVLSYSASKAIVTLGGPVFPM